MAMMTSASLFNYLYSRLPPAVVDADEEQMPEYPLRRYLQALIEDGMKPDIEAIVYLTTLVDPTAMKDEHLPYFIESFGLEYYPDIDILYQRRFAANIGEVLRRRGTYSGVRYLVRVLTGLDIEMVYERYPEDGGDVNYRLFTVTLLAASVNDVLALETHYKVIEDYLKAYLPYYINVKLNSRIVTQSLDVDIYRTVVMASEYKKYEIPE